MAKLSKKRMKDIADAIHAAGGIISDAAAILEVERGTLANFIHRYPDELNPEVEAARAHITEIAENRLHAALKKGEPWAVQLQLKAKGGYSERKEITTPKDQPLTIKVVYE